MSPEISIVVPLFNEDSNFQYLKDRLTKILNQSKRVLEVMLIDDGSSDNTPVLMKLLAQEDPRFQCIFLSRNFGHQVALSAGIAHARASEAILIIDGDLQDPPEMLEAFYSEYKKGFDVVYAIRRKRKEVWYKRMFYSLFYSIIKRISNIHIPPDSGDFSLISRRVVDVINSMPEQSRFIRGMRSWAGFKQTGIEYDRDERFSGETKYSFRDLINLAYNGIFNFSEFPVKFITNVGILTVATVFVFFSYALIKKLWFDVVPEGYITIVFVIMLFGGAQLMALGILGEYVLRIFMQVKNRPLYTIKEKIIEGKIL